MNAEFWNSVIFSDEKTFQSSNNGRLRVYRPRNSRFDENYTLPTNTSGRFSVNVWAWISVHEPGVCWKIDGRFTAINYINILENIMLPSVSQLYGQNFVYQHVRIFVFCCITFNNDILVLIRITVQFIKLELLVNGWMTMK